MFELPAFVTDKTVSDNTHPRHRAFRHADRTPSFASHGALPLSTSISVKGFTDANFA